MKANKIRSPSKDMKPLSDADRHKRFVEAAEQVGASKKAEDFEAAFKGVVSKTVKGSR
jgi:hypothetical protein